MAGTYGVQHFVGLGDLDSVSGVVATLPAGIVLGQAREENGIKYRLVQNDDDGPDINQGQIYQIATAASGNYSVTVSTLSGAYRHIGGGFNMHATATSGDVFWGAVRGDVGNMECLTSVTAEKACGVAVDGEVSEITTTNAGHIPIGLNMGATATAACMTGNFYIQFE